MYIYIYICIEREREMYAYLFEIASPLRSSRVSVFQGCPLTQGELRLGAWRGAGQAHDNSYSVEKPTATETGWRLDKPNPSSASICR